MLARPRYPDIGDHALLGDCHSTALVTTDGTVDWLCLRRFDGPTVCASLLDHDRGGHLVLRPREVVRSTRAYDGDTLVLTSTFTTRTGQVRLTDAFAMSEGGREAPAHLLLRVVDVLEGEVELEVELAPRFDYGDAHPWLRRHDEHGTWSAVAGEEALVVATDLELAHDVEGATIGCTVRLAAGERRRLAVRSMEAHRLDPGCVDVVDVDDQLATTLQWWCEWSAGTATPQRHGEAVARSTVVLKALTCAPTGAIVAAATTSLPELVGGGRNWDYRYTWVRDATLTLDALSQVGHEEVAAGFRRFVVRAAAGRADELQIMYGPYGQRRLPEVELDLEGYRGSAPVRIGNGAASQVQLDVYGHLLAAAHLWDHRTDEPLDPDEWRFLRRVVDTAAQRWRDVDRGIWEVRGEPRHFVESKVMCWVALDRGVRLAEGGAGDGDLERWRGERDAVRETVMGQGLDRSGSHFVRSFGERSAVDASLLRLPLVGFVDAHDDVMRATVAAVREQLAVGDAGLLRRYDAEDGLEGGEGTFLLCSFWLVEALALQGDVDEAEDLYTSLLDVGNDLGLFAEQVDADSGQLLGNFPQAFTHLGVVRGALQLATARGEAL